MILYQRLSSPDCPGWLQPPFLPVRRRHRLLGRPGPSWVREVARPGLSLRARKSSGSVESGRIPFLALFFFLPQRGIEATTSLLRQPYFLKREEGGREEPRQPRGTPRNQLSGTLQICFMLLLNVDASFFSLVSAAAQRILPGKSSVLLRMRKKGFPPQRNKKRENKTENKEK